MRHARAVTAVSFSPNGKTIATASYDKTARRWDAATGKPLGEPMRHEGDVVAVSFSPDGKTIATASRDKTVRLWDATTGKPLSEPMRHESDVVAVSFNPDGKTIATASINGTARLNPVPQSMDETPERINCFVEWITHARLSETFDEYDFGVDELEQAAIELDQLGGPPEFDQESTDRREAWMSLIATSAERKKLWKDAARRREDLVKLHPDDRSLAGQLAEDYANAEEWTKAARSLRAPRRRFPKRMVIFDESCSHFPDDRR